MSDYYIGLMSGTSLDGIDVVLVDFQTPPLTLVASHHHPIPAQLRAELDALTRPGNDELARLGQADARFGELLAEAVLALLARTGLDAGAIEAIGSHGQTLRHWPDAPFPATLQIGDPNRLAELTGITTVADFRRRDMAAGGQGAPLVPAFHDALFRQPQADRLILNIGGIANLTLLPADPARPVSGFDTGPGNGLMDAWIGHQQGKERDDQGQWAAAGRPIAGLLAKLLADPYFRQPPPKSTGRDHFHLDWLQSRLDEKHRAEDVQATLLQLTVQSIAEAVRQHAPDSREMLVCGGGVHNHTLMTRLAEALPQLHIGSTAEAGLDPDWVEATAFAWLARQTLQHLPGNLPAVTGARHPVILGGVYPGQPGR